MVKLEKCCDYLQISITSCTKHVPSKLRNPILADVFGRMRLMERRGSGFKKILDAYEAEERYKEELKPVVLLCRQNVDGYVKVNPEVNGKNDI